jgi:Tfp pilus assembly protein FimT
VDKRKIKSVEASPAANRERGFSIVEMVVVLAMTIIIAAIATIQLQPTLQQFRANAGLDQLKAALRQARETAISQRRTIVITFPTINSIQNTIQMYQMVVTTPAGGGPPTVAEATTPFNTVVVEGTVQFMTYASETDTPDGYVPGGPTVASGGVYTESTTSVVVAGGPTSGMEFQSDGTFTDGNGSLLNATIFVGVPKMSETARAATLLGGTGRVRTWSNNGSGWVVQ